MMPFKFMHKNKLIQIVGYSENDWIFSSIVKSNSFYELSLLKYIRFILHGRRGVILDVGANIGNHCIYFSMFTNCSVVAFEPNPIAYHILSENIKLNNLNPMLFDLGLGDKDESFSTFLNASQSNNVGATKLVSDPKGLIRVKRLDSLISEIEVKFKDIPILAIKADIEGMEPNMLLGARDVLDKYRPDLFLEINDHNAMQNIKAILAEYNYVRVVSWADTPVWHFISRQNLMTKNKLKLWGFIIINKFVDAIIRLSNKLKSLLRINEA